MPALVRSFAAVAFLVTACTKAEPPAASVASASASTPVPVAPVASAAPDAGSVPEAVAATDAVGTLRSATTFDDVHIGYSGSLSPNVAAFRQVLARPGAADVFRDLVEHGTPAGRLYGVSGLYLADRPAFAPAVARLSAAGGDVTRFQGCEQGQDHVASVLRSPGPARVVVAAGETLEAARARAPRGAACDIEGGCIPLSFAAAK